MSSYPMQPLVVDKSGTIRFQENKVVRFLLDNGGHDLNKLWIMLHSKNFSLDDMEQFYQLIGYSVSGFGEISDFRDETVAKADELAKNLYRQWCKKWIMIKCFACGADNWVDGNKYRLGGACLECHACLESTMISENDHVETRIPLRGFVKPEQY